MVWIGNADRYVEQDDDPDEDFDEDAWECWYCDGQGWGIIGLDWDSVDPFWEIEGEAMKCPNCGGSGKAKDCTFW